MDTTKRKERTTLFVGDLSSVCTEADLEQAFSVYGQVQQVRIQRNRMTMASMAYGFVRMTNPVESINAKNALDGTLLCGRKLRVREAEYGVGGADKGFLRKYSLYIKFESTEEGKKTNEVKIRDIFSQYGEVSDISLRKIFFDKHTGLQKGYGFIHFSNSSEGIQASFNVIADIPQIIVDGVIYVIEASNNLKSRIDAIVQDTPEAADELSDAKAFIMNSGGGGNNSRGPGNRNGYNQNQGGYGGRGHRNRSHNGYDGYEDHGDGMQGYGQGQGQGGMQMNSNGEMEWNPNLHRQMPHGGGGMNQGGYNGRRHPNQRNDGYNNNYSNYGNQNQMMGGNPANMEQQSGGSSQLDGRSKPFQPSGGSQSGAGSGSGMNPNVQEFNAAGAGFGYMGSANSNHNFNNQAGNGYGGNENGGNGSNGGGDNFPQHMVDGGGNPAGNGGAGPNGNQNYSGNQSYPDGNMNNFGGYMGGMNNSVGGMGASMGPQHPMGNNMPMGGMNGNMPMGHMPMNGDFSTDNWLGPQQNMGQQGPGDQQGFYPQQNMGGNPPMPPFSTGRPQGSMGEWSNQQQGTDRSSSHGSFDGSPSLGPAITDLSPLYGNQGGIPSGGMMLNSLEQGGPIRHTSSISSADEDEIARMLGSLDASSTNRASSGSGGGSASSGGAGGLSMDSLMFGSSNLSAGDNGSAGNSAEGAVA